MFLRKLEITAKKSLNVPKKTVKSWEDFRNFRNILRIILGTLGTF